MSETAGDYGALSERVRGLGEETHELRSDIKSIRSTMATRADLEQISSSIAALFAKIDQQQLHSRPNIVGWISASCAAISVTLVIGGSFMALWKSSVDDRFTDQAAIMRELRANSLATGEFERRIALVRDENARRDAEIARQRDSLITRSEHERIWSEQSRNRDKLEARVLRLEDRALAR